MSRFQPKLPTDLSDALFGDVEAQTWLQLLGEQAGVLGDDGPKIVMDGRYLLLRAETLSSLATAPIGTTLLDRSGRVIACVSTDDTLTPGSLTRVVSDADESRKAEDPWDVAQMSHVALRRRIQALCLAGVRFGEPTRRHWHGSSTSVSPALRSCSATVRSMRCQARERSP